MIDRVSFSLRQLHHAGGHPCNLAWHCRSQIVHFPRIIHDILSVVSKQAREAARVRYIATFAPGYGVRNSGATCKGEWTLCGAQYRKKYILASCAGGPPVARPAPSTDTRRTWSNVVSSQRSFAGWSPSKKSTRKGSVSELTKVPTTTAVVIATARLLCLGVVVSPATE